MDTRKRREEILRKKKEGKLLHSSSLVLRHCMSEPIKRTRKKDRRLAVEGSVVLFKEVNVLNYFFRPFEPLGAGE